jgi:hypothetical protein
MPIAYTLPVQQVQTSQFQVHISYFLQNCKKGKPRKMDLPLLKNDIVIRLIFLKNMLSLCVCLQKVLDKSGIKIREGFRFQIPFSGRLSNL